MTATVMHRSRVPFTYLFVPGIRADRFAWAR